VFSQPNRNQDARDLRLSAAAWSSRRFAGATAAPPESADPHSTDVVRFYVH
jgi:hypothetical protein